MKKELTKKELMELEEHKMKLVNEIEKNKHDWYMELETYKHKLKMEELEYFRKTEKYKQELDLEFHRIKNADFKRNMIYKNR